MESSLALFQSASSSLRLAAKQAGYNPPEHSLSAECPFLSLAPTSDSLPQTSLRQRHTQAVDPEQSIYEDPLTSLPASVQGIDENDDQSQDQQPSPVLQRALNTQQALREQLRQQNQEKDTHNSRNGHPPKPTKGHPQKEKDIHPIDLVAQQPDHNILVAQFQQDPEGTRDLLSARLEALDKDIDATFYGIFGNKGAARQLHGRLQNALHALNLCMEEGSDTPETLTALNTLLSEIRNYESLFHKDSWLDKTSLAFIGIDQLLDSPMADKLRAVIPPEQLQAGDAQLLDPSIVTKTNIGVVTYNDNALHTFLAEVIASFAEYTHRQEQQSQLSALALKDFPSHDQISDPQQLIAHMAQHQSATLYQILENIFTCQTRQSDPQVQQRGYNLLAKLHNAGQNPTALLRLLGSSIEDSHNLNGQLRTATNPIGDSHNLNDNLNAPIEDTQGLLEHISYELQIHYMNLATKALHDESQQALAEPTRVTKTQIRDLQQRYQQLKNLGQEMHMAEQGEAFAALGFDIARVAQIPLHRVISTGNYRGEPLWHLDRDISLTELVHISHNRSDDPRAKEITKLQTFLQKPEGDDLPAVRKHLQEKDALLRSQQDFALNQASQAAGNTEAFEQAMATARQIELCRPPYQLISENVTPLQRVSRAGRAVLVPDSQPLEQRLQGLELEHQLALDGYSFKEELYNLFRDLPCLCTNATETTKEAREQAYKLLDGYKNGTVSTLALLQGMTSLGVSVKDGLVRQLRETLTGAAALGQISPATLRALSGKFNQSITNVCSVVGQKSTLYALLNETHSRIHGEMMAQCFIESVAERKTDLGFDKLSDNERAAVRRLVAINTLLSGCIYTPTLIEGALNVATGGTSPLNLAWTAATTGARLFSTYLIDNKVNAMSGTDLKIANATLDILNDNATVAASRQAVMARSADMLADVACRESDIKTAVKASVFYPFKVLLRGIKDAFKDVRAGKPGALLKAGVMLLRAAPVVVAPIAMATGLLTLPVISLGFITVTLVGLPATLWVAWGWAQYLVNNTGLVDVGLLALDRAREIVRNPSIDFTAMADEILTQGGEKQRCRQLAKNHVYAGLSRKYWSQFAAQNATRARAIDNKIKADVEAMDYPRLQQIASTLRYLNSIDLRTTTKEELQANLPAEEADNMPANGQEHHRQCWALGLQERLRYELLCYTGSDELPTSDDPAADEKQLLQSARQFSVERLRGLHLQGLYLPQLGVKAQDEMNEAIRLTAGQIYLKTRQRLQVLLSKLMVSGLHSVFVSRAQASGKCKKGQMRPETCQQVLANDTALKEAIRREFIDVIRNEILRSGQTDKALLRQKLRSQGLTLKDEEIDELLSPASAA